MRLVFFETMFDRIFIDMYDNHLKNIVVKKKIEYAVRLASNVFK